uniref:Retrotransposon gag domain-containing protein n=1 Tax=Cajanus cajan TaxID=3821 RepID=A0A151RBT7_CAJCA|nr:hypothetical protein KK1_038624 [Cajanus cajan]
MRGDALAWFKWMFYNQQLGDWLSFSHALEVHFGPSSYENPQATLFKLKKTGTVTDYQTAFEKLNNQVFGLDPAAIRNCFISGLLEDIQKELAILKPQTVSQAVTSQFSKWLLLLLLLLLLFSHNLVIIFYFNCN